jgi:hypothetical protein
MRGALLCAALLCALAGARGELQAGGAGDVPVLYASGAALAAAPLPLLAALACAAL